jgi:hypothetical protein
MNSPADSTTVADPSAEETAVSQLDHPQDPESAELSAQELRQLHALRKAGDIGPEVQNLTEVPDPTTILKGTDDPDGTAAGDEAVKITEGFNAT